MKVIATLILLFVAYAAFAQEPCRGYPMKGYTGNCDLSVAFSSDGKYVYTSDRLTLKKWDIFTKEVVEEVSPFPYELRRNAMSAEPDVVIVGESFTYSDYHVKKKALLNKRALLEGRTQPEAKKSVGKIIGSVTSPDIFFSRDSVFALIGASSKIYRVNLTSGESKFIDAYDFVHRIYLPEQNLFFSSNTENKMFAVNAATGEVIYSPVFYPLDRVLMSPGNQHLIFEGDDKSFFVEPATLKTVQEVPGGRIYFRSDGKAFYTARAQVSFAEYSYPELLPLSAPGQHELPVRKDYVYQTFLQADQKLFYTFSDNFAGGPDMYINGFSLADGKSKEMLSFKYTPVGEDVKIAVKENESRIKIGNDAIAKLENMPVPAVRHAWGSNIRLGLAGSTDNGLVLMVDRYFSGATAILWQFPEGKALYTFADKYTKGKGGFASEILVPGAIVATQLSPAGHTIGITASEPSASLFYTNGVLTSQFENMNVVAVLDDDKALISTYSKGIDRRELRFVDTKTGTVITKFKADYFPPGTEDTRLMKGKAFFQDSERIFAFDVNEPGQIKVVPLADWKSIGYMQYGNVPYKGFMDRSTRNAPVIEGYKTPGNIDRQTFQSRYLISSYYNDGFTIYDMADKKFVTPNTIFPGWFNYTHVVYLKDKQLLLVVHQSPVYTKPNAVIDDPGASAFTINIITGEISPYNLGIDSKEYTKTIETWRAEAFAYAPKNECERLSRKFAPKTNLSSSNPANSPLIVLGFDCERNVYVVAQREKLYPGSNSDALVSRLKPMTEEQLDAGGYKEIQAVWEVCQLCNGYPVVGQRYDTYSGWGEWEQKSLNIYLYTRKWETNTNTINEMCKACKSQAWTKR
ncbi:MAG: hypothetical protein IPN95_10850 [Bacteroidetes bacterium]|nr:hypothetical protein [Bacteroidota bacterium]